MTYLRNKLSDTTSQMWVYAIKWHYTSHKEREYTKTAMRGTNPIYNATLMGCKARAQRKRQAQLPRACVLSHMEHKAVS